MLNNVNPKALENNHGDSPVLINQTMDSQNPNQDSVIVQDV